MGEEKNGGKNGKGHQEACIKDPRTKATIRGGLNVGGGGG